MYILYVDESGVEEGGGGTDHFSYGGVTADDTADFEGFAPKRSRGHKWMVL